eukprot:1368970-Rhodomonas_salina.1
MTSAAQREEGARDMGRRRGRGQHRTCSRPPGCCRRALRSWRGRGSRRGRCRRSWARSCT